MLHWSIRQRWPKPTAFIRNIRTLSGLRLSDWRPCGHDVLHGKLMNDWANRWVHYWSDGATDFVTSAMEETGTYQALTYLDNIGRVDVDRFMVLRGGSDYTMQPPGFGAAENLLKENDGYAGLAASLENIYIVGSIVMDELLDNWDQYSVAVPGSQSDSDENAQQ